MTAGRCSTLTTAVTSPSAVVTLFSLSPNAVPSAAVSVSILVAMPALTCNRIGAPDLVLELQNAVEQRLGGGWAPRHIDIDRNDAVAAAHHRIRVVVIAPAIGARAHRNDPTRLGHLIVDFAQRGRHLVAQGARNDHDIGLARTGPEHHTEAVQVVARGASVHHLHRAAGKS